MFDAMPIKEARTTLALLSIPLSVAATSRCTTPSYRVTMRWENPLMGWTSTGDPYANVGEAGLTFDSAESAKAFAEKHGWDHVVRKRHTPLLKPKSYAENFKWRGPPKAEQA
ncbi:hypothetical protein ABZP36_002498 [Zizania latifolia]